MRRLAAAAAAAAEGDKYVLHKLPRVEQSRTGQIQDMLGQNRASLVRAGLGQVPQGTAGADNTGQGWAKQSRAGRGRTHFG